MTETDLKPRQAVEMYIGEKRHELRDSTIKSKRSRLGMFVDYCENNDIDSLADLDGIDIHRYRISQADNIARRTLVSRLSDVRLLLKWAESIDAVDTGFHENVQVPNIDSPRTRTIEADRMKPILEYLQKYEYASRDHAIIRLLWRTGMRLGALRGIDCDDYYPAGGDSDGPYIQLHHRPETDTPLKNGTGGERPIALDDGTKVVLDDYLELNRVSATDDYDRNPMFTTVYGRPGIATLRRIMYRYTRPCVVGEDCPHDRDPLDCEATENSDSASLCPSSVSPHDIRRGSITNLLRNDVPKPIISDRCDVSTAVLDEHYDKRSDIEKMDQRRDYLENI